MKTMIALPTLSHVSTRFMHSLLQALTRYNNAMLAVKSNSLIYSARSELALEAVRNDCDQIIWIDSDIILEQDTLGRLIESGQDKDFLTGLYFTRCFPLTPVISKKLVWDKNGIVHESEPYHDYPENQVFKIAGSGFGCCLTKTKAVFDVAERFSVMPFTPLPGLGEDYSFCYRMTKAGYELWCDSSIKVGHIGEYVFDEKTYLTQKEVSQKNESVGVQASV